MKLMVGNLFHNREILSLETDGRRGFITLKCLECGFVKKYRRDYIHKAHHCTVCSQRKKLPFKVGDKTGNFTIKVMPAFFKVKGRTQHAELECNTCKSIKKQSLNKLKDKSRNVYCGRCSPNKGKTNKFYKSTDIVSAAYFKSIQYGAGIRNIPFDISIEYISDLLEKQNFKCALTNLPIFVSDKKNGIKGAASLDRIDSSKNYVENNVQWLHKLVNKIKQDLNNNDFIKICNLISQVKPISDEELTKFVINYDWNQWQIYTKKTRLLSQ